MKRKLTDLAVARMRKPAAGRLEVWDTVLPAFGLRVSSTGSRTWIVALRRPGSKNPARLKVGTLPPMTLAQARAKAREMMEGGAPAPAAAVTFEDLAEQFLEHGRTKRGRLLRTATKKEYRRALMTYATPLHTKLVRDVRRGEIAELISTIAKKRGATSAMRTRAALSRFFSWLLANDRVDGNPVIGTEGYDVPKRERVLSDGELRTLWAATEERTDFNFILRLLLWTGCRRSEAGAMAWSELECGCWTVPGSRTKNHRPLVLPLPRQACAAVDSWPRIGGKDLLFGRGSNASRAGRLPKRGSAHGSSSKRSGICTISGARSKRACPGSGSQRITSTRC